ncbi:MAG TPA: hypothetical protein VH681_14500 [Nitrospiraceae bacterium]|jgi:hypothetical protein
MINSNDYNANGRIKRYALLLKGRTERFNTFEAALAEARFHSASDTEVRYTPWRIVDDERIIILAESERLTEAPLNVNQHSPQPGLLGRIFGSALDGEA